MTLGDQVMVLAAEKATIIAKVRSDTDYTPRESTTLKSHALGSSHHNVPEVHATTWPSTSVFLAGKVLDVLTVTR